jgi:hypothetical protein
MPVPVGLPGRAWLLLSAGIPALMVGLPTAFKHHGKKGSDS